MYRQFYMCVAKQRTYLVWLAVMGAVLLAFPLQCASAQDCNDENCPAGCCGDTCCEESETCCDGSCCATSCCGTTCLAAGQDCCNGQPYYTATKGCCNGQTYTRATHCCVGNQVVPKCGTNCCTSTELCCGDTECYDPETHGCCNGVKYNKATQCCYEGEVQSKVDTDDDEEADCCVLPDADYDELTACPGTKTQDPEYDPDAPENVNGCTAVPDNPCGNDDTSFHDACDAHDTAWNTCGTDKAAADQQFFWDMQEICWNSENPDCNDPDYTCEDYAQAYVDGVSGFVGGWIYENTQVAACVCCVTEDE